MSIFSEKCAIWGTPASVSDNHRGRDGEEIDSPRSGGSYFVSGTALAIISDHNYPDRERRLLTTWLVNQRKQGVNTPEVTSETLKNIKIQSPLSFSERLLRLVECIDDFTLQIGTEWNFQNPSTDVDFLKMMGWSESTQVEEVKFLLKALSERGLINYEPFLGGDMRIGLSSQGYIMLDDERRKQKQSEQAFVAMWFDKTLEKAFDEGFEPAIRNAGFNPLRIDRKEHNNKIDDEIIAEIRRSRFLVADFTQCSCEDYIKACDEAENSSKVNPNRYGARGGVYYEAGFAHGLNIPVIFACRHDAIEKVHFDTRQYNHIVWSDPADLRIKLKNRILAVIGEGPLTTQI